MKIQHLHPWDVDVAEARKIQERLRERVVYQKISLSSIKRIAGADVSFDKSMKDVGFAAVCVFSFPGMQLQEKVTISAPVSFPYIPGLLSFRESPPLLEAFRQLNQWPDVILMDAQGVAHPRRFGAASHIGVLLDCPTIGCAKTCLIGEYTPPDYRKGEWTPLLHNGEEIGRVLRTRNGVDPVFVSVGHLVDADSAIQVVLACVHHYRIPEPLRMAHTLSNTFREQCLHSSEGSPGLF